MKPVLKSLIAAVLVEGLSFALFALGGFGPCGPSNPLGFAALLLNIFPGGLGGALVLNALEGRVRPELLDGPAVPILIGVVQLGFYWLLFLMLFKRRGQVSLRQERQN
jgi:hypothetical protein